MKSQKSPRGLRVSPVSVSLLAAAMATLSSGLRAEFIAKENNTTALDLPASWINGVVPTSADVATYSSANTASSTPATIGAGVSFGGIAYVSNPVTNMTINAGTGGTLTLGASGIDVSAAGAGTRNLVIGSSINLTANQTWKTGIAAANTSQISANGVISGPGGLNIVGDSGGTNQNVLLNSASNTFSGGVTLNAGGGLRVAGTPVVASGVITSSCLGTGPLVVNGGTFFSTGGSIVSNATVNGDFTVNVGQGATGNTHANNGRFTIAGGTWNLGAAVRNVSLGRFNKLQGTNNVLTSGFESMRLLLQGAGAAAAPAISVQNGTLRFIRENSATPTAPTETDYSSVVFGLGALFANGAGFTVGDHVVTVFATGNPFGTTAGAQPIVGVEPNGYFNLSDSGNSRSPNIRGLTGTGGTVTNFSSAATVATSTLTITPIAGDSFTFPGKIVHGASEAATTGLSSQLATIALTKAGAGTQILTGPNTYTGATAINAGKLVTNTSSSNGTYTVAGSATLGVKVDSAGSDLNMTSLTLGASALEFNLGTVGNPTTAVIANSGPLVVNGTVTVSISGDTSQLSLGTFPLLTSAGARSGSGSFTLGTLPLGLSATLAEVGSNLNLTITGINPIYQWTGATNATWDLSGANTNWTISGNASAYAEAPARDVVMDDSATGSTTVTLSANLAPLSLTVDSSAKSYALTGTGKIGGAANLTKAGSSTLTVSTANDYSGATQVNGGTLRLGAAGVIPDGSGKGLVTVNGILDLAGFAETINGLAGTGTVTSTSAATAFTVGAGNATSTFDGVVAGPLSLVKTGTGTVSLAGVNTFTGAITISAGTLQLGVGSTLGALPAATTIDNSGTFSVNRSNAVTQGTDFGLLAGSGALLKQGAGALTLNQANTYTGVTTVSAGNLVVAHNSALGGTAGGTVVTTGGAVVLNDGVTVTGETVTLTGLGNGSRGLIRVNSGSATWDGPVILNNQGADVRLGSSIAAGGTLTFAGVISGGDTTGIGGTYTPTATVRANSSTDIIVFAAANTFAGDFQVNGGTVVLSGGANRLPVTARYVAEKFSGLSSTFDLNGNNQTFAGLVDGNPLTTSGSDTTVTNTSATAATLTINPSIVDNSFTGSVTGNLALIKNGAGTTTLAGTHGYTGDTTVNAGTLAFAQSGLDDGSDITVVTGATLALNYDGTDVVNTLTLGGQPMPPGVYGSVASSAPNVSGYLSGSGTLTVTTGAASDPYAAWAAGYNFNGGDSTASGDPDNDGIKNLLEWVLAGDPTVSDAAATGMSVVKDATHLNLVFDRSDSSESAVTLEARWGTDLSNWTDVTVGAASAAADANGVIVTVVENGAAADNVTVSIPLARASGGRLFGTLRATQN